tara:strand:- start:894 stop:1652 length:759 start_codon:yes stop_codon:yes gene_type:complete
MNSDSDDETPINMDLSHLPNIENLKDERNDANAYGFENTSYITATDMDKILDSVKSYDDACATPGELVKLIHFNVDHPENRNLVMNDNGDTCIFDGKDWRVIDKDTFHNAVVDRAFNMITNYYERRRELYKLKNNLLRVQYELLETNPNFRDEIASKIRKIEDTQILVSPILCPNHPKKPSDKDLKYEVTIFDIYGSGDNLKNYYNNKTRQLEISLILEGNINSEQKDKLNIELIELNSKIIEFEELEKKIV